VSAIDTQPVPAGAATLGNAEDHVATVLSLVGRHVRALNALLTVSSVEWNDRISTACVECIERPRLLLNPTFVARHCATPHRLAMLILHELMHITLGHTRLFPKPTAIHNIAFDAIINRSVLAVLQGAGVAVGPYADLLTDFYRTNQSPEFILRPPPGWPENSRWNASEGMPASLRTIHRTLYRETVTTGEPPYTQLTYSEIISALRAHASTGGDSVALLGAHGTTAEELVAGGGTRDVDAADALASALNHISGLLPNGAGDALQSESVRNAARTPSLERALRLLLRRAAFDRGDKQVRWEWGTRDVTVVHRMHDRRAACRIHAARALGAPPPLLFAGQIAVRRPQPLGLVIYVDVSGSMQNLLPHLRRALHSLRDEVKPSIYWFSTKVVAARPGDLDKGRVQSTGGTAVSSVLRHAVQSLPQGSPALVLTDGYLETVHSADITRLKQRRNAIHLGVIGGGPLLSDARWVTSSTRLPTPSEKA